ncbi:Endo-1,4-beta-xylanase A precursor [compost metagenome]
MVIIARALEKSGKLKLSSSTSELSAYRDRANVSEYAAPSVAALLRAGIVNGYNSQILPKQPVTRAEAAVIIYNTLKQYQQ